MGKKKKLIRFADLETYSNVLQPELSELTVKRNSGIFNDHPIKGNWRKEFIHNDNPIVLELGCGKGEYSVGMGKKYPNKNFIGVDIKGARIWYGAHESLKYGLNNVFFLRTRIDFITNLFASDEVDEIWITFPDPQPQQNRARKRLTGKLFTDRYKKILKSGGIIHLKTDSDVMYESTLEQIEEHGFETILATSDLYKETIEDLDTDTQEILSIKTHYEQVFTEKGFSIKYIKFRIH